MDGIDYSGTYTFNTSNGNDIILHSICIKNTYPNTNGDLISSIKLTIGDIDVWDIPVNLIGILSDRKNKSTSSDTIYIDLPFMNLIESIRPQMFKDQSIQLRLQYNRRRTPDEDVYIIYNSINHIPLYVNIQFIRTITEKCSTYNSHDRCCCLLDRDIINCVGILVEMNDIKNLEQIKIIGDGQDIINYNDDLINLFCQKISNSFIYIEFEPNVDGNVDGNVNRELLDNLKSIERKTKSFKDVKIWFHFQHKYLNQQIKIWDISYRQLNYNNNKCKLSTLKYPKPTSIQIPQSQPSIQIAPSQPQPSVQIPPQPQPSGQTLSQPNLSQPHPSVNIQSVLVPI